MAKPDLPITIAALPKGDAEIHVTLDEYKGTRTIDIRVFEKFSPASAVTPTRKGVTLAISRLPELARALADAERQARELGLLDG